MGLCDRMELEEAAGGKYGYCSHCGGPLIPVWFEEKERVIVNDVMHETGRVCRACSHLVCDICGSTEAVDDSFDGLWT